MRNALISSDNDQNDERHKQNMPAVNVHSTATKSEMRNNYKAQIHTVSSIALCVSVSVPT